MLCSRSFPKKSGQALRKTLELPCGRTEDLGRTGKNPGCRVCLGSRRVRRALWQNGTLRRAGGRADNQETKIIILEFLTVYKLAHTVLHLLLGVAVV